VVAQIHYIRPPTVGLAYDDWKEEALCRDLPPYLFELQDFDDVERGEQEKVIAMGLKVCSGCPVRAACKSNSSELDRYWTTRGGQPPEGLFLDSKRPKYAAPRQANGFLPGEGPSRVPPKKCKRGHSEWVVQKNGKRRCKPCQVEASATDWQRRKEREAAKKAALKESQSDA
jgi:hypothetical protein